VTHATPTPSASGAPGHPLFTPDAEILSARQREAPSRGGFVSSGASRAAELCADGRTRRQAADVDGWVTLTNGSGTALTKCSCPVSSRAISIRVRQNLCQFDAAKSRPSAQGRTGGMSKGERCLVNTICYPLDESRDQHTETSSLTLLCALPFPSKSATSSDVQALSTTATSTSLERRSRGGSGGSQFKTAQKVGLGSRAGRPSCSCTKRLEGGVQFVARTHRPHPIER